MSGGLMSCGLKSGGLMTGGLKSYDHMYIQTEYIIMSMVYYSKILV